MGLSVFRFRGQVYALRRAMKRNLPIKCMARCSEMSIKVSVQIGKDRHLLLYRVLTPHGGTSNTDSRTALLALASPQWEASSTR
jgi:hypothetical protein